MQKFLGIWQRYDQAYAYRFGLPLVVMAAIPFLFLNTCATLKQDEQPTLRPVEGMSIALLPEAQLEPFAKPLPAGVAGLLQLAGEKAKLGDFQQGLAQLERAYRLEGKDYRVLFALAEYYLSHAALEEAEDWAERALSTLPKAFVARRYNTWLLIAETRKRRGDQAGQELALQKAQQQNIKTARSTSAR